MSNRRNGPEKNAKSERARRKGVSRRVFLSTTIAGATSLVVAPSISGRAAAATVVKIGHTEALTGPSAAYGLRARDGSLLAVKEINAAGGFKDSKGNAYTFEMSLDDMANDPKQAITLFRRHALDSSNSASMGPISSVGFSPIVPVSGQLKLPLLGSGSTGPVRAWSTWAYRINPVGGSAVPIMMKKLRSVLGYKRLAVIYDQTQDSQIGDAEICKSVQSELGYEVVAYEAFRTGDQDFSPQIAKIKSAKPDAIYVAAATGDGVKVVPQIRNYGLDMPLITGVGSFQDPVFWDGTSGAIKGGYTWLPMDLNAASGKLKSWLDTYNKSFELAATPPSIYSYDTIYVLAECVKRANSAERDKIRDVLSAMEFTTPLDETIKFKNPPHGDNLSPSVIVLKVTGRNQYEKV